MAHTLLDEVIANLIRVEITHEPGEPTAKLSIRNDVEINTELRTRGKRMRVGTANVAGSAAAISRLMREELVNRGVEIGDETLVNLPVMTGGERNFSATTNVKIDGKSDAELRITFSDALKATIGRMGTARFRELVGYWSDRRAGKAADQGLVDL